jgi:hypothetical protein
MSYIPVFFRDKADDSRRRDGGTTIAAGWSLLDAGIRRRGMPAHITIRELK